MAQARLLYIGTDDGLLLLTDPGAGGRWLRGGHELRGLPVRHLWVNSVEPTQVLALAGDGLHRSVDGGRQWVKQCEISQARALIGGHTNRSSVYLLAGTELLCSADGGASWSSRTLPAAFRALAAGDDAHLYAGLDGQGLASHDEGATWEPFYASLPAAIDFLASPPAQTALFALAGGTVYQTAASAWHAMPAAPERGISLAVLAAKSPTILLALENGGIARGNLAAWEDAPVSLPWDGPAALLTPAVYHMDVAFAASASGIVAQSSDRGRTWMVIRQGLAPVHAIASARLA